MPEELAAKARASQERSGERRHVTVLFADISGFTAMAEKLDPEDVTAIMEECFRPLAERIYEYEGTIDKFMGDAIMVVFGAPIAHEDDPQRALRAALEMQETLEDTNSRLWEKWGLKLAMHIGVNSGVVVAGEVGAQGHREYTVMGDVVNVASRLEAAAEVGTILVSEATYRLTSRHFDFEPVESMRVKGKTELVRPYRLLGLKRTADGKPEGRRAPLIGRDVELALLRHLVQRAVAGKGQIVSIVGEAGVGKSRLVAELKAHLAARGLLILASNGLSFGGKALYLPFIHLFRSLCGIQEDDSAEEARRKLYERMEQIDPQLVELAPHIGELLSPGGSLENVGAETRRRLLQKAIRQFLIRYAQMQPLALIIEDLHWVDPGCLEALSALVEGIANVPMLVAVTHRPDFSPAWARKSYYSQLGLGPLSRDDSLTLIEAFLQANSLPPSLKEMIASKAEGNPFFIEEAIRSLMDSQALRHEEGTWVASGDIRDVDIPDAVQNVIMARIDRLAERERAVIQCAAILGESFPLALLRELAGDGQVDEGLARLEQLELVHEAGSLPEVEYRFKTGQVRDVVYQSILIRRRKELHALAGAAIERLYPEQWEKCQLLLYHYRLAEEREKIIHCTIHAANQAASVYALEQALGFYRQALDILKDLPESAQTYAETLSKMAELHQSRGASDEALAEYQEALRVGGESLPRENRAELYRKIGHVCATKRRFDEAASSLSKASQLLTEEDVEMSSVLTATAWLHWHKLEPQAGMECAQRGLRLATTAGDLKRMAEVHDVISNLCLLTGDHHARVAAIREGLALSERMGDLTRTLWGFWNLAFLYEDEGSYNAALESLDNVVRLAERTGFVSGTANAVRSRGEILYLKGEWGPALESLEQAETLAQQVLDDERTTTEPSWLWWLRGLIYTDQGRLDDGLQALEKALGFLEASHIRRHLHIWLLMALGRNYLARGRHDEARAYLEQALAQQKDDNCVRCGSKLYPVLAELYAETSEGDKALQLGAEALGLAAKVNYIAGGALAHRALGRLAAARGMGDEAEEHFAEALKVFRDLDAKYELAKTLYHFSRFYRARGQQGDWARASDCLEESRELFLRLGAERDLATIGNP